MRSGAVVLLALSLTGCAAVFRGTNDRVQIESTPAGATAKVGTNEVGPTPASAQVKRRGLTAVTVTKPGYEVHNGAVRKQIDVPWLLLDLGTCIFTLCIPLIIDAASGAWMDVDRVYLAELKPALPGGLAGPSASGSPASASAPASNPGKDMSESERKATARAAYIEGVELQEQGKCADALTRLEAAQKLYSAPTHLLHIAQCQAATGKLVESSETYETLVRMPTAKDGPNAFRSANEDGKKELASLRPRIPTLRIQIVPPPASLAGVIVKSNGVVVPPEVMGIARPVDPGHYRVTVWAAGFKEASIDVDVSEGTPRNVDLKLFR